MSYDTMLLTSHMLDQKIQHMGGQFFMSKYDFDLKK